LKAEAEFATRNKWVQDWVPQAGLSALCAVYAGVSSM